jgi:hypothetical protein
MKATSSMKATTSTKTSEVDHRAVPLAPRSGSPPSDGQGLNAATATAGAAQHVGTFRCAGAALSPRAVRPRPDGGGPRRVEPPSRKRSSPDTHRSRVARTRRRWEWSMVRVVAVVLLGVTGCSRHQPCAPEDVRRVAKDCRLAPAASPSFRVCHDSGLAPPAEFDVEGFDAMACTQTNDGALFACMASRAAECRPDGGAPSFNAADALLDACLRQLGRGLGTSSESPGSLACEAERRSCEARCPTTTWDGCAACDAACGRAYGTCLGGVSW